MLTANVDVFEIVAAFNARGFYLDGKVVQSRINKAERASQKKHLLRFYSVNHMWEGSHPEIVVADAHTSSTSWIVRTGLSINSPPAHIVTGDSFPYRRIMERDYSPSLVEEAIAQCTEQFPLLAEQILAMKGKELKPVQRIAFAKHAAKLREQDEPPSSELLLGHTDDKTVWGTFLSIRENLMEGVKGEGKRKMRPIQATWLDVLINSALYDLAASYVVE